MPPGVCCGPAGADPGSLSALPGLELPGRLQRLGPAAVGLEEVDVRRAFHHLQREVALGAADVGDDVAGPAEEEDATSDDEESVE